MTTDELRAALDGLFAYDTGCVGSGIKDEQLRQRCIDALRALSRPTLAALVRDMWLSDEAIGLGYGAEDAAEFLRWLDDSMGGLDR